MTMAASYYTVYVPDRDAPYTGFLASMTPEEVRAALVATGNTAVETAEMVLSGSTIKFRRVQGGTKG